MYSKSDVRLPNLNYILTELTRNYTFFDHIEQGVKYIYKYRIKSFYSKYLL